MNESPCFVWIPAALRLAGIWIGSAVLWYFFGPVIGLLAGLALTTAMTIVQLYYLSALDIWLDSPRSDRLPDGWERGMPSIPICTV